MRRLFAIFLLASMTLLAQAPARKGARAKQPATAKSSGPVIDTVRVEGGHRISEAELIRLSGVKPGQPPTKEVFEAARDRLLETGCVETVSWRYGPSESKTGYEAVISITEADQFLPWSIDRLPVTEAEFAALASKEMPCFGKDLPTYERYLTRATALMQKLLAARGVKEQAAAKVGLPDGKTLTVVFQPSTPPPNIYDVQFTGNKSVPGPDLRKPLAQAAIGLPYSETLFRQLLENQTRPIYETIGRLTVTFPSIKVAPSAEPGVHGVLVVIEVDEGSVYTLDEIKVEGAPIEESQIEKLGQFDRGKTINHTNLGLAMERILGELRNRGYLNCSYKALRSLNQERKTANMTIQVTPGDQFVMGKLTIAGLDVITEPVIRKLWILEQGKPFRKDYPDSFLNQIRARGVLDFLGETKSSVKLDEVAHRADVTLTFKGGAQPLDSRQPEGPLRRPQ
jgi:outer membrane protein assembly factor BamA